jgi:hypothetical protein
MPQSLYFAMIFWMTCHVLYLVGSISAQYLGASLGDEKASSDSAGPMVCHMLSVTSPASQAAAAAVVTCLGNMSMGHSTACCGITGG